MLTINYFLVGNIFIIEFIIYNLLKKFVFTYSKKNVILIWYMFSILRSLISIENSIDIFFIFFFKLVALIAIHGKL
jgi:hypothetical protein